MKMMRNIGLAIVFFGAIPLMGGAQSTVAHAAPTQRGQSKACKFKHQAWSLVQAASSHAKLAPNEFDIDDAQRDQSIIPEQISTLAGRYGDPNGWYELVTDLTTSMSKAGEAAYEDQQNSQQSYDDTSTFWKDQAATDADASRYAMSLAWIDIKYICYGH